MGGMGGGPGMGGRNVQYRGEDIEATVTISFMESCSGTAKNISVTPIVECKTCTGSGLREGKKRTTCQQCRGTGQQTFSLQGMMMASTCPSCGGTGSQIPRDAKCGGCEGVGRVKEKRSIQVDIPAGEWSSNSCSTLPVLTRISATGIEDGMKIRMPTVGDIPLSGPGTPGDLLVRVNVIPSKTFRRQGSNLYHQSSVPIHIALLGGKMRIPTLEGDVEVKIKSGTRDGEEAVLKGRGVKSVYGRERGDLVVNWKLAVPR
jgi:molecular chaperone DnaJ